MVFFEKSSVSSPADREYPGECYKNPVVDERMLRAKGCSGAYLLKRCASAANISLILRPARALSSSACQRGDLVQSHVGEGTGVDIGEPSLRWRVAQLLLYSAAVSCAALAQFSLCAHEALSTFHQQTGSTSAHEPAPPPPHPPPPRDISQSEAGRASAAGKAAVELCSTWQLQQARTSSGGDRVTTASREVVRLTPGDGSVESSSCSGGASAVCLLEEEECDGDSSTFLIRKCARQLRCAWNENSTGNQY
jgi:hypothetical protein